MDDIPLEQDRPTPHYLSVMGELNKALDQISDGQSNQGIKRWETYFQEAREKLSLTEALFFMTDLAGVLFENGLLQRAKEYDQQILDDLEKDEDNENPLISPDDRAKLREVIGWRYDNKAESSNLIDESDMSGHCERIGVHMREYSEQVITYSSPSLLQPLGSNTTTSGLGQDIPFLRLETRRHSSDENLVRAQSAEEAEDKNEIATSNEAHLQSLPTLPDEGILNPSSGRISAISKVAN